MSWNNWECRWCGKKIKEFTDGCHLFRSDSYVICNSCCLELAEFMYSSEKFKFECHCGRIGEYDMSKKWRYNFNQIIACSVCKTEYIGIQGIFPRRIGWNDNTDYFYDDIGTKFLLNGTITKVGYKSE